MADLTPGRTTHRTMRRRPRPRSAWSAQARTAPIAAAIVDVRAELNRMDTKANTLLGWSGTAAALGLAALSQVHLPVAAAVLGWLAVAQIAAAVGLLAAAIQPKLSGDHGFVRYARVEPADIADVLAAIPEGDPDALVWLSRRVRDGYRHVRAAVFLLLAALPTAAAAALAAALIR
ncbi:MAG: hypothetical protein V7603_5175 [Micromonosporaceae bacterium]